MRDIFALSHGNTNTIQTYLSSAKQYIIFHNKQHPMKLGVKELEQFLRHLVVQKGIKVNSKSSPQLDLPMDSQRLSTAHCFSLYLAITDQTKCHVYDYG